MNLRFKIGFEKMDLKTLQITCMPYSNWYKKTEKRVRLL